MKKTNSLKTNFFKDAITTCTSILSLAFFAFCVVVSILLPSLFAKEIYAGRFAIILAGAFALYLVLAAVRDGIFARKPLTLQTSGERIACIVFIVILITLVIERIVGNPAQLFRRIVFYADSVLAIVSVVLYERARIKAAK